MSENIVETTAANAVEKGQEVLQDGMDCVSTALDQGKSYVRSNPAPAIAGALVLGFVIGLLVPREPRETHVVNDRIDELKDLLGSLGSKVSARAEDGYGEVSSLLADALKKAKKRFNLS